MKWRLTGALMWLDVFERVMFISFWIWFSMACEQGFQYKIPFETKINWDHLNISLATRNGFRNAKVEIMSSNTRYMETLASLIFNKPDYEVMNSKLQMTKSSQIRFWYEHKLICVLWTTKPLISFLLRRLDEDSRTKRRSQPPDKVHPLCIIYKNNL